MYYYTSVPGVIVRGSAGSGYTIVSDSNTNPKSGSLANAYPEATVTTIYSLRVDNMPIYNSDKLLTINVTTTSGTFEGTYDIDSYYIAQKAALEAGTINQATFDKIQEIFFAIRAYSASAAAYRFGPAKNANGEWVYWY